MLTTMKKMMTIRTIEDRSMMRSCIMHLKIQAYRKRRKKIRIRKQRARYA